MEDKTNTTNSTNSTEQKTPKTNWFKSHLSLCIILVIIIAAVVAGAYFLLNKGDSPEQVAEKYVNAMSEGSSDKILEITDLKGAYAWEKCGKDADKFLEQYKNSPDFDVNSYKDTLKKSLDQAMAMLKTFGDIKISLQGVEKPEEIAKGLYKVKAKIKMEAFGQETEQTAILAVYNGKYIGEISE